MAKPLFAFLKDTVFYVALLLAPMGWFCYAWITSGHFDIPEIDTTLGLKVGLSVLLYPILEEIVFRGGLQHYLRQRGRNRFLFFGIGGANVVTSLVFAIAHILTLGEYGASLVFFPSIVFGYFYDRYNRLAPGIVLHAFYNGGLVFISTAIV